MNVIKENPKHGSHLLGKGLHEQLIKIHLFMFFYLRFILFHSLNSLAFYKVPFSVFLSRNFSLIHPFSIKPRLLPARYLLLQLPPQKPERPASTALKVAFREIGVRTLIVPLYSSKQWRIDY